ncbi:MAG: hypothetical protein MRY21_07760 [Simkaniaceae bacterium]|nr:hypothetical protein [Simkaniaceae bacterium]
MAKKAAVITAKGFGDGLMMMIASHRLLNEGYEVTTYNPHLYQMQEWFPDHKFAITPDDIEEYDLIVLQNDNSAQSKAIICDYRIGRLSNLSVFYPTHEPHKHGPLTSWDQKFDASVPMTNNIAAAISSLLDLPEVSKNNGLVVPAHLERNPKRVIIHPTSTTPLRTWTRSKFISLGKWLLTQGLTPCFITSPSEWSQWHELRKLGFEVPLLKNLSEVAATVYQSRFMIGNESGISHLASNLGLPTLVVCGNAKRIALWRPGWYAGSVVTPPNWVPNIKGLRLRDNKWQHFISTAQVKNQTKSYLTAP